MTDSQFWLRGSVVPQDQTNFPQQIGIDPATGDLYLTQSEDSGSGYENLTISRFVNLTFASMMTGLQGHGTPLLVEHQGNSAYLTFPYRGATGGDHWVRLPFIAGKAWSAAEALGNQYKANPLPTHPPAATKWMQGEAEFEGYLFRLVGGPFNDGGPTMDGGAAEVEIIRDGVITARVDASMLGRQGLVSGGAPINHRLEPEGLTLWPFQTAPILVVGIANGRADNDSLLVNLYSYSLDRAGFVSDDAPATMPTGSTAQVNVTMRNTGYTTWSPGRHFLGEGRWVDPAADQPLWGETFYSVDHDVPPGQQITFSCPIAAASPYLDRQWWMVRDPAFPGSRYYFGQQTARVHIATNDAQYVRCEGVPGKIPADASADVAVVMRNTGNTTWSATAGYRLGALADDFGNPRLDLAGDVRPGQDERFDFAISAPGGQTASFQWRMVQDGHEWFGSATEQLVIERTEATECQALRRQISGLQAEKQSLSVELTHAAPQEKPEIAAEIAEVSAEIQTARARMRTLGCNG